MANTTLEDICDLFSSKVRDNRLVALYQSSGSAQYLDYLEPWVLNSIDDFESICTQDISTYSTTTQSFSVELTRKNKNVLARIMTKYWLEKELQDIQQMKNYVQDKDFRTHSANQAYEAKQKAYAQKCEEISQLLVQYGYDEDVDWENWKLQDFD